MEVPVQVLPMALYARVLMASLALDVTPSLTIVSRTHARMEACVERPRMAACTVPVSLASRVTSV